MQVLSKIDPICKMLRIHSLSIIFVLPFVTDLFHWGVLASIIARDWVFPRYSQYVHN